MTDQFWGTPISSIAEKGNELFIRVQNVNVKLKSNELHFLRAFPNIQIPDYEEILKRLQIKEKIKIMSLKKRHQISKKSSDISVEEAIQHK